MLPKPQPLIASEVSRLLAVASQVFGYPASLESIEQEIKSRRGTKESREEIAYVIDASNGGEADSAVLINVVDHLIEKVEDGKIDGTLGFVWIEDLLSNVNEGSKAIGCVIAVVLLQVLAGAYVFGLSFSELSKVELVMQAAALVVLVSTASVVAAWGWSMNRPSGSKLNAAFLSYFYGAVYAFVLYKCGVATLDYSAGASFGQWFIILATFIPTVAPVVSFVRNNRGPHSGRANHIHMPSSPITGAYEERLKHGIIHLQEDIRIHPED